MLERRFREEILAHAHEGWTIVDKKYDDGGFTGADGKFWRYDFGGKSSIVELYVSYLRKKIEATGSRMIHTVHGVGYVLKPGE